MHLAVMANHSNGFILHGCGPGIEYGRSIMIELDRNNQDRSRQSLKVCV
jgi:hypothetical protein